MRGCSSSLIDLYWWKPIAEWWSLSGVGRLIAVGFETTRRLSVVDRVRDNKDGLRRVDEQRLQIVSTRKILTRICVVF